MPIMQYKPIYTVKEAADLLATSRSTVGELLKKGEIPYLKINGMRKIRGSDLERFIESHPTETEKEQEERNGK